MEYYSEGLKIVEFDLYKLYKKEFQCGLTYLDVRKQLKNLLNLHFVLRVFQLDINDHNTLDEYHGFELYFVYYLHHLALIQ